MRNIDRAEQQSVPVVVVLQRLTKFLKELAETVSAVEATLIDDLDTQLVQSDRVLRKLQYLDTVQQSLEDLSVLNQQICAVPALNEAWSLQPDDIYGCLKLDSVKSLLNTHHSLVKATSLEHPRGDVDFF